MKKTKVKTKVSRKKNMTLDLPQNIISVGERVYEDKNIYIHQKVYEQIHKFSANKTENEHGGILVGRVLTEMGKENIIIEGFIEARYNAATPTTLTFTHETWKYFHTEIDKKYKDKKIVGWIHTHPNFGIFLSENDRFIQQNFFTDSNQVAYVVDPIQNEEGFFFWINGKLERCPGFYLFDKNGVKIKQKNRGKYDIAEEAKTKSSSGVLLPIIMTIIIIANIFFMVNQSSKINKLEKEITDTKKEINNMKQVINNQLAVIQNFHPLQIQIESDKNDEQQTNKKTDEQQNFQPNISKNDTKELSKETKDDGGTQ